MKLIKNGMVMTMGPQGTLRADVLIEDGKIVRIAENITAEQAEVIDASGLLVCRGWWMRIVISAALIPKPEPRI